MQAIHQGLMTRDEGIDLVNRYDGKCSEKYIKQFCDYIEISNDQFWEVLDKHVNKDLFQKKMENGVQNLKFIRNKNAGHHRQ